MASWRLDVNLSSPEKEDYRDISVLVSKYRDGWKTERERLLKTLNLTITQIEERLGRLTDAYIDGTIDKEMFLMRKESLITEQKDAREKLQDLEGKQYSILDKISEFLEQSKIVYSSYISGLQEEKREMLQCVTSNRVVDGKNLYIELKSPFRELADYSKLSNGGAEKAQIEMGVTSRARLPHQAALGRGHAAGSASSAWG